MDKIEEIKNLKSLVDKGEINESEFQMRKQEIILKYTKEISKDETNPHQVHLLISAANVMDAGICIKKSVTLHVLYVSCYTIAIIVYMFASVNAMGEIMKGRSVNSVMSDSPSLLFSIMLMMAGGIFWILSLVRMTKAGNLLQTSSSSSLYTNVSNEPVKTTIETEIKSHFAPEIVSQNKSIKSSLLGGESEIIMLEFADGTKGSIEHKLKENKYFFKEKRTDVYYDNMVTYDNLENCINALHYFLTTGEIHKVGYLGINA